MVYKTVTGHAGSRTFRTHDENAVLQAAGIFRLESDITKSCQIYINLLVMCSIITERLSPLVCENARVERSIILLFMVPRNVPHRRDAVDSQTLCWSSVRWCLHRRPASLRLQPSATLLYLFLFLCIPPRAPRGSRAKATAQSNGCIGTKEASEY